MRPSTADRVVSSARATDVFLAGLDGVRRVLVVGAGGLEREVPSRGPRFVAAGPRRRRRRARWDERVGMPPAHGRGRRVRWTNSWPARRGASRWTASGTAPASSPPTATQGIQRSVARALRAGGVRRGGGGGRQDRSRCRSASPPRCSWRWATGNRARSVLYQRVGDLSTDLAAAVALGIPCILMLTGVSSEAERGRASAPEGGRLRWHARPRLWPPRSRRSARPRPVGRRPEQEFQHDDRSPHRGIRLQLAATCSRNSSGRVAG